MPLLVRRVGARRARAAADVCDEWPERRGGVLLAEGRGDVGARARGAALSLSPALSRGGAIGWGAVCCRWRAMGGLGGGA